MSFAGFLGIFLRAIFAQLKTLAPCVLLSEIRNTLSSSILMSKWHICRTLSFANLWTTFCTVSGLTFASPSVVCFYWRKKLTEWNTTPLSHLSKNAAWTPKTGFLARFASAEALICPRRLRATTSPPFCTPQVVPRLLLRLHTHRPLPGGLDQLPIRALRGPNA